MKGYVLVHGAWHNSASWAHVTRGLRDLGHIVEAVDLPGAGPDARFPASFGKGQDGAFASEASPSASVTQQQRTDATIAAVRAVNDQTGGKAILVGHSQGGVTLSPVAETITDELSVAVYLTAFMLPPGMQQIEMIQHPLMEAGLPKKLLIGDPGALGVLRLGTRSSDLAYRAKLKEAFYGDVDQATFETFAAGLHCDEPFSVSLEHSPVTVGNFGRLPRHYIQCLQDRAIVIGGQREMVRLMDEAMGNTTTVHTLDASHSPFLSMPAKLVEILADIAT